MIELAKQYIDDTLLSVDGALTSMEAGLKPFDTEQMSGGQELMSVTDLLLTSVQHQMSMEADLMAIGEHLTTIEPDQMSVVKALMPHDEALKSIVDTLKPSALYQVSKA